MFRMIKKVCRVTLQNQFASNLPTTNCIRLQSFASTKKPIQEQPQAPQTIQISKQEYQEMVKFMQDIKYSDPSQSFSPTNENNNPNSSSTQSIGQLYFSSDEHKLSFQLMKLNSPLQYFPHFETNLENQNYSVKLIILYMYCMAGGIIGMNSQGGKTEHLSYEYMKQILDNLSKLDENQLERFLQLYLSLKKTEHDIPTLNLTQSTLPLIKSPSHHNASLLTLLIQFVSTCNFQSSSSSSTFKPLQQILKYYKVEKTIQVEMSELKQLAFIGMTSIGCGFVEDDCLDSMIRGIQHGIMVGLNSGHKKKIIEAYQVVVVKLQQLKDQELINKKLEKLLIHMKKTILALRNNSSSQEDIHKQEISVEENTDKLDKLVDVGSGRLSALLYETMLVLEHGVSSGGVGMCVGIIKGIVQEIRLEKDMTLNEYEQCWKSGLIMMRLKHQALDDQLLYGFVNSFLQKCDVIQGIRNKADDQSQPHHHFVQTQDSLFNILLSYRIILPPSLNNQNFKPFQNCHIIQREVGDGQTIRTILKELIEGYRSLIGKIYEENVVVSKDDAIINHLTIVCFIADAYKFDGGLLISKLLDERVKEYLLTLGIKNEKYRLKIESLLERNKN